MLTRIPSWSEREQDTEDLSQQRRFPFVQFILYFGKLLHRRAFLDLCPLCERRSQEPKFGPEDGEVAQMFSLNPNQNALQPLTYIGLSPSTEDFARTE